ncbi:yippee-like protein [Neoconidiobolus thromboides FSU 785]|nr:yippee-like protein [Neoconidiobolus thromboides FSU 785]
MGQIYRQYLSGSKVFACSGCNTHLTTVDLIVSKAFQGQHGQAYLFKKVVNVDFGEAADRHMTTGLHTVRDIVCNTCGEVLGWSYIKAYEESQKYKEGMFILEKQLLTTIN